LRIRNTFSWAFAFVLALAVLASASCSKSEARLVDIGDRQLAIDCSGAATSAPLVVLLAGANLTSKDWASVQRDVSASARVCSYDRAGLGRSESAGNQSADQIVNDLQRLLEAAGETPPYVLVAHSWAGIQARKFATQFPEKVAAMVLVDSSHEEQAWRLYEIKPIEGALSIETEQRGYFAARGQRLQWQTDLPLVVIARGLPLARRQASGLADHEFEQWERTWRDLQIDLARRSTRGELRVAAKSDHMIPQREPQVIADAVRDVLSRLRATAHSNQEQ
jgi:pimeloyl-ACP methyl ester carboxylesterase